MALKNVSPTSNGRVSTQVAIVASGFGGLATAHYLKQAGTGASALQFIPAIQPDVAQIKALRRMLSRT